MGAAGDAPEDPVAHYHGWAGGASTVGGTFWAGEYSSTPLWKHPPQCDLRLRGSERGLRALALTASAWADLPTISAEIPEDAVFDLIRRFHEVDLALRAL